MKSCAIWLFDALRCNNSVILKGFEHREIDQMQKAVNAVNNENKHCEFVYGSSELNLLPLEDFDYSDPRCNPLRRSATARTPSNTTAHQPASCVCLTHFFYASARKATRTYCGSLRQSSPRPDPRLLRQAALEALTRSARTNTPRKTRPEQLPAKWRRRRAAAGRREGGGVCFSA
ncbi:hypothetical protein F511_06300 [Dorcoceras hygrometricum]|uniref:Uncharacterized protein n=1 Tax=Dorcoceras hygrometricum TaxID=472368 RepID=A0A2Z7AKM2_9LAMI|nr:hypothetical protein F511_06300 [Dorcoceras hygrometricum]